MDEVEENNLRNKARFEKWKRWNECSLCEQKYHGVVRCALGWACWKAYLGRPETDEDPGATLDDLREAVASLEETERIARRVLGGAHPLTAGIDTTLRNARVVLRARESLLAQYLLYGASALAITAFALFRRR